MNISELGYILEACVGLVLIVFMWLQLWPELQIDIFRQRMFEVRDELFLYAARGGISFDDPAYRLLRKSMNGYIRYAHRLGPFQMLFTYLEWKAFNSTPPLSWTVNWDKALKNVKSPKTRSDLENFHRRATKLVVRGIIMRSGFLLVTVMALAMGIALSNHLKDIRQSLRKASLRVARLMDLPLIEEAASRAA